MRAALIFGIVCCAAHADEWQKPDEIIRALALKPSDVVAVVEPKAELAPRISKRVRGVVNLDNAHGHSIDVIVVNGIDHRADFYAKLRRSLRLGGRVVDIDSSNGSVEEFKAAGFRITRSISVPPHQIQVFE